MDLDNSSTSTAIVRSLLNNTLVKRTIIPYRKRTIRL